MLNIYSVYVHISPSQKMYIGITCKCVQERWQQGEGYKLQPYFYNAIQKYGWNNIKHIVLLENLSKEMACECEKYLIAKYKTNNPNYGYNLTGGGEGLFDYKHTEETKYKIGKANSTKTRSVELRNQISESVKELWQNPNYRERVTQSLCIANKKEEHRKHISEALKGRHLSDECKQKLSRTLKGREITPEARKKISEATRLQHKKEKELGIKRNYTNMGHTKNTKWYNNGEINIRCKESDKPNGFIDGRIPKKKIVEKEDVF